MSIKQEGIKISLVALACPDYSVISYKASELRGRMHVIPATQHKV